MNEMEKMAFHPSYYLKDYLEEIQMTQDEFAKRLGISGKQISLIFKEEASITPDIAYKLSRLMGTSIELWLNLQSKYDAYLMELAGKESFEKEKEIYKMIDKNFLLQLGIIDKDDKIDVAISKLRLASTVSSLQLHCKKDIFCMYREADRDNEKENNTVCKNVWVSIAFNQAKKINTEPYNEDKLKENIANFRKMTMMDINDFFPEMQKILSECGVAFVVLPSLKNSKINGAVKWIDKDKVMVAVNTRGAYNDRFWFSFFHELQHVFQKKRRKIIVEDELDQLNAIYEYEADLFAKETLISSEDIKKLNKYDEESILAFSRKNNIHPGIVVGRLQKESKISYSHFNYLKQKYEFKN